MRLAVLGSPIAHSRSPRIHAAAYRALGLDWRYEAVERSRDTLDAFLDRIRQDGDWRGLSLTAPLKEAAAARVRSLDETAMLTGACNTIRVEQPLGDGHPGDGLRGWNTDVDGTVRAFRRAGVDGAERGLVLGGGATAASSLVALERLGVSLITVAMRSPEKAGALIDLGERLGVRVDVVHLSGTLPAADVVVSTLPASAEIVPEFSAAPSRLLDADYANGSSRYKAAIGDRVISGLEMLVEQALLQVRIFVGGDPDAPLGGEERVLAAMREAAAA